MQMPTLMVPPYDKQSLTAAEERELIKWIRRLTISGTPSQYSYAIIPNSRVECVIKSAALRQTFIWEPFPPRNLLSFNPPGPVRTLWLKGLKAKFLAALNSKYLNLSSHCEKIFTLPIQR